MVRVANSENVGKTITLGDRIEKYVYLWRAGPGSALPGPSIGRDVNLK